MEFIVNYFAPSRIWAWLRTWLYRVAQAIDILWIFSSLDGTSSVRLKLCCTAAPGLLIFSSLDGSSSVRLKLCYTAAPMLLIFSSLDGTSSVRLKSCCTAAPRLLILSSLDGSSSSARPKLFCTQARKQAGALGASIAPQSRCTLWRFALQFTYTLCRGGWAWIGHFFFHRP